MSTNRSAANNGTELADTHDEENMQEIELDPPTAVRRGFIASQHKSHSEIGQEAKVQVSTEVAAVGQSEAEPTYKLSKTYMKTPCNHSYHIACLKKWMDIRLECPTCRHVIPVPDDD